MAWITYARLVASCAVAGCALSGVAFGWLGPAVDPHPFGAAAGAIAGLAVYRPRSVRASRT